jgi:nitrite reductase/ring-hydroxylating ferredoxin subunit
MAPHKIGELDDFPEDRGTKVSVDGVEFVAFNFDGELYGIHNRCPHKRLPMHVIGEERYYSPELVEDGTYCLSDEEKAVDEDIRGGINKDVPSVNCPWHALEFDLETGYNPIMDVHVATYDIEVRADDTVWVEL